MSYEAFLARKAQANDQHGFEPLWMPEFLFGFQQDLTAWAIRQGRGAIFADCGLGKAVQALTWAQNVYSYTGRPVLIIAPLAVSFQLEQEAAKFGLEASVSRDGSVPTPLTITNYERLEHFSAHDFAGAVCDESSAIKSFDSRRRAGVTEFMRSLRYRLLCTATAAPNDYIELGTSSEALGYLGHMDMLNRFFTNKLKNSATGRYRGSGPEWRFKGHAEEPFWKWVCSWARAVRKPSDLGYEDGAFELPDLGYRTHVVEAREAAPDRLFDVEARGLQEEREQIRRTITERCEMAAQCLMGRSDGPAIGWVHLNDESSLLTKLTDGVEIKGSDPVDDKEQKLIAFSRGEIQTLVTKPSLAGHGMNFQHAHRMSYFPSWSYEQHYQAVRRMYRFGQKEPVTVDVVATEGGRAVMEGLREKSWQADRMFAALVRHMQEAQGIDTRNDDHDMEMELTWA